ncbi:carbohydrate binding family 9 domain-containing protein [candidate division KSB1 bacterium]|nr:carbohydrate binding family 9 domain-containing protein [candidate division KSB1 bacterium]
MKNLTWTCIVLYFIIVTAITYAKPQFSSEQYMPVTDQAGFRVINTSNATEEIKIDGCLMEKDWQKVSFQDQFKQREPFFDEPTTEKTLVGILQDKNNLYIGIQCFDSEPEKIIAREMRRDSRLDNDDNFQIVIDTYHDRRNGFYFNINPLGAKRDATLGDEGKNYNPDWDGIWECATRITNQGWFAEVSIPWKTLRFAQRDTLTWGINFSRGIRRKNEECFWQLVSRDAGRFGLYRLSQAGTLVGLTKMSSGGNVEIEPYILGGAEKDASTNFDWVNPKETGIDAKIGLTSNLGVKLTWNTDFAQVESDQEQVNLTRFSLYFPEKREFFLDGAEMFNFGGAQSSRRGGGRNSLILFYSRRIGIVGKNQQPIIGGAKLLGKVGQYEIGILNMQTEAIDVIEEEEDDDGNEYEELVHYPKTNFTAVRMRRELFQRSNIGVMFLNKEEINSSHYNRSGGFDAHFPITDRIILSGAIAGTIGPDEIEDDELIERSTKNKAGLVSFSYNSDLWEFDLSHLAVEENFDAEMGFIRRTNIKNSSARIEFNPRPKNIPSIRQFQFRLEQEYMTDFENIMQENTTNGSFSVHFQNSARVSAGVSHKLELIDEDWEIREDIIIPQKTYGDWNYYLRAFSDESADLAGNLFLNYGDFFSGKSLRANTNLVMYNIDRIRMDLNVNLNHVTLPYGNFDTRTFGLRFNYFFSTKLYLKAYLQWNDDRKANDGNKITLANVVVRWIYRPGSDIYLVYNDNRLVGPYPEISNRTFMLKATYFWRK